MISKLRELGVIPEGATPSDIRRLEAVLGFKRWSCWARFSSEETRWWMTRLTEHRRLVAEFSPELQTWYQEHFPGVSKAAAYQRIVRARNTMPNDGTKKP